MVDINIFTVTRQATLLDAIAQIDRNHSRTVLVVEKKRVVGLLSEGDVLRALLYGHDPHVQVEKVMSCSFHYLTHRDYKKAFELFRKHLFGLIPVVDEEFTLKSVITLTDLLGKVKLGK